LEINPMLSAAAVLAKPISFSAPGSLMLGGEHAVLHGQHALAGAVDRRIKVSLSPRNDDNIRIISALGERLMPRTAIDAGKPFHFIGAILQKYATQLTTGFELQVEAQMAADVGLGSSAAISAATLAAIKALCQNDVDNDQLLAETVSIIRKVQGRGSGTDAAAAIFGGIVLYKANPPEVITRYTNLPPITLIYAGYKTPTPDVIAFVEKLRAESPDSFTSLFNRIDACTMFADQALRESNWNALGNALNRAQLMMEMLGICDDSLREIVASLQAATEISGAKISGSGLGDCAIGIGKFTPPDNWPYKIIPISLSEQGLKRES
jgi:mevalonate kinase